MWGGIICPHPTLVEIGLTDLPKSGTPGKDWPEVGTMFNSGITQEIKISNLSKNV